MCVSFFSLHNNRTGESCESEDMRGGEAVLAGLSDGSILAVLRLSVLKNFSHLNNSRGDRFHLPFPWRHLPSHAREEKLGR